MTFTSSQRRSADRQVSPVFLVLLAILGTTAWALAAGYGNARVGALLFVIAGWLVSLCLHEYAHARTALHSGDSSIAAKGYLTLNPFKYAHALLSVVLPVVFILLGGIGLPGGAVFIERHRIHGRLKHSLISAAGPAVNLVFGVVLALLVGTAGSLGPLQGALAFLAYLQLTATVLNLLPVPGLDGYGIIEPWLSWKTRRAVEPFAPYGMLALFAVIWQTKAGLWLAQLVLWLLGLLAVPDGLVGYGNALVRFWA